MRLIVGMVVIVNATYVEKKTTACDICGHSSIPDGDRYTTEVCLIVLSANDAKLSSNDCVLA